MSRLRNSIVQCVSGVRFGVLAMSMMLGVSQLVQAAHPQIAIIKPSGLQRGTELEVEVTGARLNDVKQVLFYDPGLEAKNISVVDDNRIKFTVSASNDATCDLHALRVVTSTGISNLRLIGVSPYSSANEVEPNSEFAKPQPIPMNSTVDGVVQNEDVDYYVVEVKKGQTITAELEGLRHAHINNFFDPFVAILDENRFELARSDDSIFLQQDCVCTAIAPEDGRYIIEVRESSFGGTNESNYRMHVGSFSRPIALVPAGGPPGQPLQVTCTDPLGNSWQETVNIPADANGVYKFWSSKDGISTPSPNILRVNAHTNVVETEPNEDINTQPVHEAFPIAFNGSLQTKGDRDWFVISAKKDQTLDIKLFARKPLRSPLDGVVEVVKVGGGYIGGNDDSNGPDSLYTFKAPADGNYAISVRDHLGAGGPHYCYRLEVEPQAPFIETNVKEQERYFSQTVVVPRGSRMAIEPTVARKYVGGDVTIQIPDLPQGMTHSSGMVSKDLDTVPLLFKATGDAPQVGKLVDLAASLVISPEKTIIGHLNQRSQLVRGQNNVDVWGHNADRLAVVITDPAPFDIEVVQPQVPLVRDGTMPLIVKAKRNEGFDKPINLRLLYTPPGVAASGSISIPPDKSEVELPLTANGGAALRSWPITVLATADTGRGAITIASEFVNLEVVDRIFKFKFNKTMAEQGKSADIVVGVEMREGVPGTVEVEVLGLPPGTKVAEPKKALAADTKTLGFTLEVPPETRAGNYKTVVCRGTITSDKGVVTQVNGNAEVQIDVPLPPKPAAPAPAAAAPAPAPAPAAAAPAQPEKPLSRLEQLRKQREGK